MSEIIQLTDTARLRIEPDQDATNPRTDHTAVGFVKIGSLGDSRLIDVAAGPNPTARIAEAMDLLERGTDRYSDDVAERVARWARIFHDLHLEWDAEHGGFWFVDEATYWGDVEHNAPNSLERQAEIIAGERATYRQWADSEVDGVILERASAWTKFYENGGDAIDGVDWNDVKSIWGCYLDDTYTAQVVASEYFDLSDEEEAALGLASISD